MLSHTDISGYPLSSQQRYLQSLPGSPTINHLLLCLRGPLDRDRLARALDVVVERHESLRTKFCQPSTLTVPLQIVEPQGGVAWESVDWGAEENLERTIAACRQAACQQFQSLETLPLVRAVLGQRAPEEHWLLVSVPAICADTESLHNLALELAGVYGDRSGDLIPADEVVQYPQFVAWQQELAEEDDTANGRAFWSAIASPPLSAPLTKPKTLADKPGPTQMQMLGWPWQGSCREIGDNSETAAILLAAWLVVLWRQTEREEFAIGVRNWERSDEALAEGLGAFQVQMPLQVQLDTDMTVAALTRQVGQTWQQMDSWQDYFQPESVDLPVGFEFVRVPNLNAGDVEFEISRTWSPSNRNTLRLRCIARDETLRAELHYDPTAISLAAVRAIADQWQTAVTWISSDPTLSLSRISLLGDGFPTTITSPTAPATIPVEPNILQTFARVATDCADRVAVADETQRLTYSELDRRSNQLAHALVAQGAGPEVPIALYAERTAAAIVAMLAILKAGSAYLPIDPALPAAGVARRLQDADVPLVITQTSLSERLPQDAPPALYLDAEASAGYPETPPDSSHAGKQLAYLLYTSGSTGEPKAVAVEHRQLMAYTRAAIARLQLPADANYAVVSTLAADLGHTMVFPCLVQGGTLHLLTGVRASDSRAFASYCQEHGIDCLKIVPSHLQVLLQGPDPGAVLPRQRLILGGEACRWPLIETILAQQPSCQIFNHYGPTETTVGAFAHPVTAAAVTDAIAATVPIGKPLAGVEAYALDTELKPVPVGVPGELYIGGATLSRGYFQRPELNAERFIDCVCPGDSGALSTAGTNGATAVKLYRTGDRVRLLPDGTVEFLGRVDRQVKLHGFRIELGEIETVLGRNEAISEVAAVVREDRLGNPILVAYVTPASDGTSFDSTALRQYLQGQLPEYAIPSLFVTLKALPLTPNGKVNRQALPAPEKVRPELSPNFVAPSTELEEAIAEIWCEVLQLETVGVRDNFFELGGHSLLATQVLSRLQETFTIELPLQRLFDARTIADIAEIVEEILIAEVESLSEEEVQETLDRVG
ncbi:amino acid adenylation domain protein [Rubidibacter lacunae KORDI 51-2]|uniref:Amino acid adenylation domain protein n=1 Tax=Rubidibacter lacunae KORDI 51-2 TaxID=582515 RepID=U5DQZ4_9CHRO|nr:non-ribosomal peptide synthetase [Rubidibacter lacunae]ERN42085.1 amino acid adenylation domain protein [Rubidibacter lacunae KORDI 51-2]